MKYFKTLIYKILKFFGYSLLKIEKEDQKLFFEYFPKNVVHNIKNKDTFYKVFAELDEDDLKIIDIVFKNNLTMVSFERVIDTILAVKYVVERGLDGDFVECGPYRGGNSIAAKLKLENLNSNKQLFLYDTFTGMSVPNPNIDKSLLQNQILLIYTLKIKKRISINGAIHQLKKLKITLINLEMVMKMSSLLRGWLKKH